MEAAKKKRTTEKAGFTRYEKRLRYILELEVVDEWTVQTRYNDLKVRWERVQEAHDEYSVYLTEADDQSDAEQWINDIMTRYDQIELEVGQKLKLLSMVSKTDKNSVHNSTAVVKIDKMKFQVFEGDMKKYPEFRAEFVKHVQPQCSESQLAFVLKQHLSESVRDEMSNVLDDYTKMWQRLDQRYGKTSKIVDAILADVKRISLNDTSDSNVLQMINIVEKAHRDLERLGEHAELRNSTSISMIEQAMPMQMKHEWVKLIASVDCSNSEKFDSLLAFLGDWRNRLEYLGASIRDAPDVPSASTTGSTLHVNRLPERQKTKCWLHKLDGPAGEHPIWKCKVFLGKSKKERRDLVVSHKACVRCLLIDCEGANDAGKCARQFNCFECQGLHNSRLHDDSYSSFHLNQQHTALTNNAILPMQSI